MRLGLANLPVILALKVFSVREYFLLLALKILVQAFISGTLFSYIFWFSFTGTLASGIAMLFAYRLFYRKKIISNLGISLCGALANNIAQLSCSSFFLFGQNTRYVAPVLLLSGFVTGIVLGLFVEKFEASSVWFATLCGKTVPNVQEGDSGMGESNSFSTGEKNASVSVKKLCKSCETNFCSTQSTVLVLARLLTGFAAVIVLIHARNLYVKWGIVLVFLAAVFIVRKKVRILPSLFITLSVTFFHALNPFGEVLFYVGKWAITLGALQEGLAKSSVLVGMVFVSQFAVSRNITLPGRTGFLVSRIFHIFDELPSPDKDVVVLRENSILGVFTDE